jgi:hypothetical protein
MKRLPVPGQLIDPGRRRETPRRSTKGDRPERGAIQYDRLRRYLAATLFTVLSILTQAKELVTLCGHRVRDGHWRRRLGSATTSLSSADDRDRRASF